MVPAVSKALPAPPRLLDVVSCICIVYGRACINVVAVTSRACLTIVSVKMQWDAIILLLIEKRTSELCTNNDDKDDDPDDDGNDGDDDDDDYLGIEKLVKSRSTIAAILDFEKFPNGQPS